MQRLLICSIRAHCMARIHPYSAGQGRGAKKRGKDMIRAEPGRALPQRTSAVRVDYSRGRSKNPKSGTHAGKLKPMPPTIGRKAAIQFFGALQRAACGLGESFRRLECPAATDTP
jgi:hypothetical protein